MAYNYYGTWCTYVFANGSYQNGAIWDDNLKKLGTKWVGLENKVYTELHPEQNSVTVKVVVTYHHHNVDASGVTSSQKLHVTVGDASETASYSGFIHNENEYGIIEFGEYIFNVPNNASGAGKTLDFTSYWDFENGSSATGFWKLGMYKEDGSPVYTPYKTTITTKTYETYKLTMNNEDDTSIVVKRKSSGVSGASIDTALANESILYQGDVVSVTISSNTLQYPLTSSVSGGTITNVVSTDSTYKCDVLVKENVSISSSAKASGNILSTSPTETAGIGENITVNTSGILSTQYYALKIECPVGVSRGYIKSDGSITEEETRIKGSTSSITFKPTASVFEKFMGEKGSQKCRITCIVYDTSTSDKETIKDSVTLTITSTQSSGLSVSTTLAVTKGSKTSSLIGNTGNVILNYDKVSVTVTGTSGTIKVGCNNEDFMSSSHKFDENPAKSVVFKCYAENSSGDRAYETVKIDNYINYVPVTCELKVRRQYTSYEDSSTGSSSSESSTSSGAVEHVGLNTELRNDAKLYASVSGSFFSGDFGSVSNTLTVKIAVTATSSRPSASSSSWVTVGSSYLHTGSDSYYVDDFPCVPSGGSVLYGTKYYVYVMAYDKTEVNTYANETSYPELPIFDYGQNDFTFNVPVIADTPGTSGIGYGGAPVGKHGSVGYAAATSSQGMTTNKGKDGNDDPLYNYAVKAATLTVPSNANRTFTVTFLVSDGFYWNYTNSGDSQWGPYATVGVGILTIIVRNLRESSSWVGGIDPWATEIKWVTRKGIQPNRYFITWNRSSTSNQTVNLWYVPKDYFFTSRFDVLQETGSFEQESQWNLLYSHEASGLVQVNGVRFVKGVTNRSSTGVLRMVSTDWKDKPTQSPEYATDWVVESGTFSISLEKDDTSNYTKNWNYRKYKSGYGEAWVTYDSGSFRLSAVASSSGAIPIYGLGDNSGSVIANIYRSTTQIELGNYFSEIHNVNVMASSNGFYTAGVHGSRLSTVEIYRWLGALPEQYGSAGAITNPAMKIYVCGIMR